MRSEVFHRLVPVFHRELGFRAELLQQMNDGERPWRVSSVYGNRCDVLSISEHEALEGQTVEPPQSSIAVGDWVLLEPSENSGMRVSKILEPLTSLCREAVNEQGKVQWIASNLDTVFIVAAFAETEKLERRSIRARRLDRYISGVREGGAVPVVLLNKVDLDHRKVEDLEAMRRELVDRLGGVEVLCLSAHDKGGLSDLNVYLSQGQTVAFVGTSGVGKSSLVNNLLGSEQLSVGAVRDRDTKGRHTTTRRELIRLDSGALVVDTPGMREFGAVAEDGVHGFDDVTGFIEQCRFSDCAHKSEPGCAVREAIEGGELRLDRFESYRDILEETLRLRDKREGYSRYSSRTGQKRFTRQVKQAVRKKRR